MIITNRPPHPSYNLEPTWGIHKTKVLCRYARIMFTADSCRRIFIYISRRDDANQACVVVVVVSSK